MKKSIVYFWREADGMHCCIDGQPDYFHTAQEMYLYACDTKMDVIEVTEENEPTLRSRGAFEGGSSCHAQ